MSTSSNPTPINIPLPAFIDRVFTCADPGAAWVAMTANAEAKTAQDRGEFMGRRVDAGVRLDGPSWATSNCYFCTSYFVAGGKRISDDWAGSTVIVIDDIGEKCAADAVRKALGEPTYIVQSSPGSSQWGYVLREPITDRALYARLMTAITIGFFAGRDPGHHDYTRYVRLPAGVNNKEKRVKANGGVAPAVICTHWDTLNEYEWQDFAAALDRVSGLAGGSAWAEAEGATFKKGGSGIGMAQALAEAMTCIEKGDYILAAFDALDMVKGMQGSQGYVEVECPWRDEHNKDDDGTGWNPVCFLRGQKGLNCFHTHGHDSNADVEARLRELLDARDGVGSFDALKDDGTKRFAEQSALSASPVSAASSASGLTAVSATPPVKAKRAWRKVGKGVPERALPAPKIITPLLARGVVTQLISRPNVGKSQLVVLLSCALASDRSGLIGDGQPFQLPGGVIIINNEDDANEFERRRNACLRANGIKDTDLERDIIINEHGNFRAAQAVRLPDGSKAVVVTQDMRELAGHIRDERAAGNDIAVVVIDTQASCFAGLDENSNGDMAAAGSALSTWAQENDVAVLLIHHSTKEAWKNGTPSMGNSRGGSGMIASVRIAAELTPLAPAQDEKLPEAERGSWFSMDFVKHAYMKLPPSRWFRKTGVDLPVAAPSATPGATQSIAPSWSTAACLFDKKGPNVGVDTSDDERRFRALHAVIATVDAGRAPLASPNAGGVNRACKVIGDALDGDTSDGNKMQKALLKAGLLVEAEEDVLGKGRTRSVILPTAAGREFVREWQTDAERRLGEIAEADAPAAVIEQDEQPAPANRTAIDVCEGPPPVLPAGVSTVDAFGDIDFGAAT